MAAVGGAARKDRTARRPILRQTSRRAGVATGRFTRSPAARKDRTARCPILRQAACRADEWSSRFTP